MKIRKIFIISLILGLNNQIVLAQFPAEIELTDLNGLNGLIINGENTGDVSGFSVASAGDVNGDGIDDLIIGAFGADQGGESSAGKSYVIFGSRNGFSNPLNLSTLNGENGFVINGEDTDDFSGISVSLAGDFNGDEINDLIIGASGADPDAQSRAGKTYIIFGNRYFPSSLHLSALNSENGVVINGENTNDNAGKSVSSAGDFNNDGIGDLIIGAYGAETITGKSYVVLGSTRGLPNNPFDLATLNEENGFVLNGETIGDSSGAHVSSAGDVNGDGIDDLIIGAYTADSGIIFNAGKSYVVFGTTDELPSPFHLSDLDGLNGFVIHGENDSDNAGVSASSAGDVNGDGVDDLIIGAYKADSDGRPNTGKSYVVYGSTTAFSNRLKLRDLNGENGFVINGENTNDFLGGSVSSAGDVNGDGFSDLIIGATGADSGAGKSYVVFGNLTSCLSKSLNLDTLNGENGFVINGEKAGDNAGISVSSAGDVNGDGIDDLIIGAYSADHNNESNAGKSYVVFGINNNDDMIFEDGFDCI